MIFDGQFDTVHTVMTSIYQLVFIVPENKSKEVEEVENTIEKMGGKVEKKDTWGKKTFAYLVNKQLSGHYFDWTMSIDTSKLKEFKNLLNLNNDVLRYLLLKTN